GQFDLREPITRTQFPTPDRLSQPCRRLLRRRCHRFKCIQQLELTYADRTDRSVTTTSERASCMQKTLDVCEVGPRDGLQTEPSMLDPQARAELANRMIATGVPRIEVASFVNPKRVPQMAGAEEVV